MILNEMRESNLTSDKIFVAGFSQGAVVSLLSALSFPQKLGGIIAMSGYLPIPTKFFSHVHEVNKETPVMMFHGKQDEVVEYEWGLDAFKKLKDNGLNVSFQSFDHMGHSACDEEIMLVRQFVKERL